MPGMGFELTIPVFEQAKTVHALDRAATVIDPSHLPITTKYLLLFQLFLFNNT
jgi:hypothetical protein